MRDYNEAAARGDDPAFHKRAPYLQPIGLPPASGRVDLRYRPRSMGSALLLFLATLLAIGFGPLAARVMPRVRRLYRRKQLG